MEVKIEPYLKIDVYSHFFKVTRFTPRILGLLLKFSHKYTHTSFVQRQQGPNTPEPKTYAIKTKDDKEFRFHIGQLAHFIEFLGFEHVQPDFYQVKYHTSYKPASITLALRDAYKLYDYQQEAKEFILSSDVSDFNTRLVTMPTGTGKGVTSLATVAELSQKFLVVVLAKYTEKWAVEVAQKLEVSPKEIMIIQGSDQLKGIIQAAQENKKIVAKCTIVSLTTLQNFFKAYEEDRFSDAFKSYGCEPEQLCEILGVGSIVIDETHEHLYGVYRLMCYSNVPKIIALSGTVISMDPFIEKIHKVLFPKEIRFDKIKMKKYIKVYPISYVFRDFSSAKIRSTEFGSRNYSQTAFEKSLMKNLPVFKNYLALICQLIDIGYLSDYKKGDKLAIYAGSIAMCTAITEHLKQKYSHLDVRRYVESDPYENVIEADIRVTTIISAGTAIDIPQLTTVIMTNSVNSPVANLQTLGRLRELPGRDPKFFYLYSTEIQKQLDYHRKRMELFEDRVAVIKEFKSPIAL
jgi:superfamily II DNA or RNA helicase